MPPRVSLVPGDFAALRPAVFAEILAPALFAEVRSLTASRHRWRAAGNWSEGVAHVSLALSIVLSCAAGFFGGVALTFGAACASTVCLALLRLSVYAEHEAAERDAILARQCAAVGLAPPPAVTAPREGGGGEPAGGRVSEA